MLVILRLGSKVHKALGKLLSLREVWKVKFHVQTILMSAWGTKPLITVLWKHKVMLVLFSLLLHVTHHAFYEDYSA